MVAGRPISRALPDEGPSPPRIRLNLPWIGKKLRRRMRGLKLFACGLPIVGLLGMIPGAGAVLTVLLPSTWALYWLCVFTLAKSDLAWRGAQAEGQAPTEGAAPVPWFLRGWDRLTSRVPGFRWSLPRWYGRRWRHWSAPVFVPCAFAENASFEGLGLGLMRLVGGLPVLYPFVRPMIPVAAAHAILSRERAARRSEETSAAQVPGHGELP